MNKINRSEPLSITNIIQRNYIIFLIFIVGLCLRLYDLGSESIWYDEAVSIAVAKLGLVEQVKWSFLQNDNNPLFYYEFLHFWIWGFGDSEFASRLPSALFGSFSILAIYMVGKSLYNQNVGLLSGLILAVSEFHIQYSQEARAYSLFAFLTLISFYYFLKLLESNRRYYFVAYVISSVLMIYAHYYGVFILLAQNIFIFWNYFNKKELGKLTLKSWIKSQISVGLLFLPGLFLFMKHAIAIQGGFWLPEPNPYGIVKTFILYSGSVTLCVVLVVFAILSIVGSQRIKNLFAQKVNTSGKEINDENKTLYNSNSLFLLILWLFVPILLPFIVSHISTPVLLFRYTIGASLAFYILSARGIEMTGNKLIISIAALAVLVFSFFSLQTYYNNVDKYQWREAIGYVEENAAAGDYVAVYPIFELDTAYYYKNRDDIHYSVVDDEFLLISDIGDKTLWLVLSKHARTDREAFEQALGKKYELVDQKQYKFLNLYQYKKKGIN